MKVYRVGRGRSRYGKILDRDTEWYTDEYEKALSRALLLKKPLYVSTNGRKFVEIDTH
jgi:hypothetical protein